MGGCVRGHSSGRLGVAAYRAAGFQDQLRKWSAEQVEDSGEQLLLYSHLASEISPGKKIVTRFLGDHPARPFGNRRARADGRNERVAVDIQL